MAKKKPKIEEVVVESQQIVNLKTKWFKLAALEKLGKTKHITKRLDEIEQEIKELSK
jgi:hypothetical protein